MKNKKSPFRVKFRKKKKNLIYFFKQYARRRWEIKNVKPIKDFSLIPIIINNFNRLTFPAMLIERLEKAGYTNIYIIDNASTYKPLLEYYDKIKYPVFRLNENVGSRSLWQTDIYNQFKNQYYIYTDPDVIPDDDCPDDFIAHFYDIMQKYPRAAKVGFGLKIDDLPEHNRHKKDILEWESQFWEKEIGENLYRAHIDTTFALCRPRVKGVDFFDFTIRTGGKYIAKHMPWYNDDKNPTEEELYYINNTKTPTHWTTLKK